MSLLLAVLSGSTEILVNILRSCDTIPDMVALATTCKHLHSILTVNAGSIIWHVGNNNILCFNDALMAVRATEIVRKTQLSGQLPPEPFPIQTLSGTVCKPTLHELESICNLQHMMRCIEHMIFNWELDDYHFHIIRDLIDFDNIEERGWDSWKQNFYRSMYRVVLAGAVCSKAYTEPFYLAAKKGDVGFFNRWQRRHASMKEYRASGHVPTNDDIEYLRRWPVYNFDAEDQTDVANQRDKELENCFGPLAEWLVLDGKSRNGKIFTSPGVNANDPPVEIRPENGCDDILRLVAAYEHLSRKIVCGDGKNYYGRVNWRKGEPPKIDGRVRKVSVVLFGVFQVEEITMPAKVEDAANLYLIANPIPGTSGDFINPNKTTTSGMDLWSSHCLDISKVVGYVEQFSTRSNTHDGHPAPDAMLLFFAFAFRKHYALKFASDCFEVSTDASYRSLAEPAIFSEPQGGEEVLTSYDTPVEYSRQDW